MKSQAERLKKALDTTGVSRRELAIALLGEDPTKAQIESKKSQIVRWLKGDGIGDENARKIAAAFTSLRHPHTERAFAKDSAAPSSWHEDMARLAARQDEILEKIDRLLEAK